MSSKFWIFFSTLTTAYLFYFWIIHDKNLLIILLFPWGGLLIMTGIHCDIDTLLKTFFSHRNIVDIITLLFKSWQPRVKPSFCFIFSNFWQVPLPSVFSILLPLVTKSFFLLILKTRAYSTALKNESFEPLWRIRISELNFLSLASTSSDSSNSISFLS